MIVAGTGDSVVVSTTVVGAGGVTVVVGVVVVVVVVAAGGEGASVATPHADRMRQSTPMDAAANLVFMS
jgi:hypothetical protein